MNCGGSTPTSPDVSTPGTGGSTGAAGGSVSTPGSGTASSTPTGQTAIDSDGVFDDSNWDVEVQAFGAGGTGGGGHLHYLGQQDGDYRRITITVNDAVGGAQAQVGVFSIKRGYVYFPSSQGALFSVSYSEDSILFSGGGNGQYSAPVLKQNGKLYTLVPGAGAFPTPDAAWTSHSLTGLTQNDFRTLTSASEHPDFSSGGSRIEVGFMRLLVVPAGSSGRTVAGGIDNWRITLHR